MLSDYGAGLNCEVPRWDLETTTTEKQNMNRYLEEEEEKRHELIDLETVTDSHLERCIWIWLEHIITENFDWRDRIDEWREIIPQLIKDQSKEWFSDDMDKLDIIENRLNFLFRDEIPPQPIDPIVREFFECNESSEKRKSDE